MVVLTVIAIMAAMCIPTFQRAIEQSRADVAAANLRAIWAAERLYWLEYHAYTDQFDNLRAMGLLDPAFPAVGKLRLRAAGGSPPTAPASPPRPPPTAAPRSASPSTRTEPSWPRALRSDSNFNSGRNADWRRATGHKPVSRPNSRRLIRRTARRPSRRVAAAPPRFHVVGADRRPDGIQRRRGGLVPAAGDPVAGLAAARKARGRRLGHLRLHNSGQGRNHDRRRTSAYAQHTWYLTPFDQPWARKLGAGARIAPDNGVFASPRRSPPIFPSSPTTTTKTRADTDGDGLADYTQTADLLAGNPSWTARRNRLADPGPRRLPLLPVAAGGPDARLRLLELHRARRRLVRGRGHLADQRRAEPFQRRAIRDRRERRPAGPESP